MQGARPTLNDVARRAGVSVATASRVLSGSRDRVSRRLSELVEAAAADLDYHPNPHARALVRASAATVAVIVHDLSDPYFSELAHGALRAAAAEDRLVMICATFRDPDREVAYVNEMRAQRMHALLFTGGSQRGLEPGAALARALAAYRSDGGRVALMVAGHGHPAAVPDHHQGGVAAGTHLAELGHRRVGVIAGPRDLASVTDRLAGVEAALVGLGVDPPRVVYSDFTRAGGAGGVTALLGEDPEITGVIALNDLMAIGAIRRLEERGVRVPADLSVVGFDDIPAAGDVRPALTTVRVPMAEIGAEAMRLALTSEPGTEDERVTVFGSRLVIRASSAQPRS